MDAFKQLAADIFWNEGYWVRTGVKVDASNCKGVYWIDDDDLNAAARAETTRGAVGASSSPD